MRAVGRLRNLAFPALAILLLAAGANAAGKGKPAPDFKLPSLVEGEFVSLAAQRGKVVYLDFWASWCPPCLVAIPALNELSKEFDDDRFQVLAINIDEDPEKARRFLKKNPVDYPSGMDPKGRLPEAYGLETMPTSFLIDQKGVVRYVHEGFKKKDIGEIREKIQSLLKEAQ